MRFRDFCFLSLLFLSSCKTAQIPNPATSPEVPKRSTPEESGRIYRVNSITDFLTEGEVKEVDSNVGKLFKDFDGLGAVSGLPLKSKESFKYDGRKYQVRIYDNAKEKQYSVFLYYGDGGFQDEAIRDIPLMMHYLDVQVGSMVMRSPTLDVSNRNYGGFSVVCPYDGSPYLGLVLMTHPKLFVSANCFFGEKPEIEMKTHIIKNMLMIPLPEEPDPIPELIPAPNPGPIREYKSRELLLV